MTFYKGFKRTKYIFSICASVLLVSNAKAQTLTPQLPENNRLVVAEEQFLQGFYKNAAQSALLFLEQHQESTNTQQHAEADKANYILAVSGLKTDAKNCDAVAVKYINSTANPTYKQRAAYMLGQFYFKNHMLDNAIEYYELAGIANLNNKEVINSKFELAYCYFNKSRFDEAEPLLAAVKELGGKYYDAGNYYYGLLAYNQNNYADALKSFKAIVNNPDYSDVVPYYIAEIYYYTDKKDRALQDAERLINKSEQSFYHKELHLLVAQIYFEREEYKKALPYFEYFYEHTDRIRKEDLYEMAYCFYKLGKWNSAIDYFKQLSDSKDSLGQNSMYLLGDCYLHIGDKKSARNAFSICSDMNYNKSEQEAALLLAAKLSFEQGYHSDAIYYTNLLLAEYPNSKHTDDAKTLMSDLLIRTNNYKEAHKALQDVKNRNNDYSRVYQKVAYGYAMQEMQLGNFAHADSLLSQSLKYATDLTYKAAAQFWKAELLYKLEQYENALSYGNDFIRNRVLKEDVSYISPAATSPNAYITMGYSAMALEKFDIAQTFFSRASFSARSYDSVFIANAILHEADAVFMQKDYETAIELYDRVIASNSPDADYALFQKATIYGLQGNNKKKVGILGELVNKVPRSKYANAARYDMGLTFIEEDKYSSAINTLKPLTQAYEIRNMAPKAWMKIGFAYQQSNNNAKAIDAYKHIVLEYPSSEERPAALDALKSLYIQIGKPESYAQLLKDNNMQAAEEGSMDSTYYETAEAKYAEENWVLSEQLLKDYLAKYPNGVFVTKANYYLAQSLYNQNKKGEALSYYDKVLSSQWSNFSENSAAKAAAISFENGDMEAARNYYSALRGMAINQDGLMAAYNGMMLTSSKLNEIDKAAAYADTVLSMPNLDDNTYNNATLHKARYLYSSGSLNEALTLFLDLKDAKVNDIVAEAGYYTAKIYLDNNNIKEAEQTALANAQNGGNEYWVVSSYMLLADIAVKQDDYFNAKATLQSIVKNCKIAELKKEAKAKLKEVRKLESKQSKLSD